MMEDYGPEELSVMLCRMVYLTYTRFKNSMDQTLKEQSLTMEQYLVLVNVRYNNAPTRITDLASWLERSINSMSMLVGASDHPLAHPPLQKWQPNLYEEYKRETGKDADKEFPIYEPTHLALAKAGIPGIEIAGGQMDEVTGKRCTLACFPLRFQGGEASLVRLVAIVDE